MYLFSLEFSTFLCAFIFFGFFYLFMCIRILFPPFCLELLLSWHGCVLAIPLSCLHLAFKDWIARCYFGLLNVSHCASLFFYFLMFIVDIFFFAIFNQVCHFCKILVVATFRLIFVGENLLRCTTQDKKGIILIAILFYSIF